MTESTTPRAPFQFRQFAVAQDQCAMPVGTDGVLLGAWADVTGAQTALDIGTGTGLIALQLAQRAADLCIDALEVDAAACAQARDNVARSPFADRISVHTISIQAFAEKDPTGYDLIVSNPPFFSGGVLSRNATRNQVRHTIKLPHGDLLAAVRTLLQPAGRFCLILPWLGGLRFGERAEQYGLYVQRQVQVRDRADTPVSRLLLELGNTATDLQESTLTLYNEDRSGRTSAYRALVEPFYVR